MLMPHQRAGEPAREQPVAAVEGVDDDDVVGEPSAISIRLGEPPLDAGLDDQPIDDDVDRVVLAAASSLMSSSSERSWPSIADLREAARRSAASSFLNSPLRPRTIGASTLMRSSVGRQHHHVDDALERLRAISRPQFGQCGTPMLAKSSRR